MLTQLRRHAWRFIPAIILGVVFWVLWKGLTLEKPNSKSAENQPFPAFSLIDPQAHRQVTLENLKGKVSVIHIWASWCSVCVKEHSEWLAIHRQWPGQLIGVVYRDNIDKALSILQQKGNPYTYLLDDSSGKLGIDLGLIGTPETFIVDKKGTIRFHYIGALNNKTFEMQFLPFLNVLDHQSVSG